MAREKKVDIKKLTKTSTVNSIIEYFKTQGLEVSCGTEYGMTDSTVILHYNECDIQVKVVAPSAKNGNRYHRQED